VAQLMGGKGSGRKPSPCGTPAKYYWHRKRGQDCAVCKAAVAAQRKAQYVPKTSRRKGIRRTTEQKRAPARGLVKDEKLRRGHCCDCGMIVTFDNTYCFDFDHRDPTLKTFAVSSRLDSARLETLKAEMDKCDLVCAICHRHRTMRQFRTGILTGTRIKRTDELPTLFDGECLQG
jgi:hypothetical protein